MSAPTITSSDQADFNFRWNKLASLDQSNHPDLGDLLVAINSAISGGGLSSVTAPLVNTSGDVSIPKATAGADGYLFHTDWSTFNGKLSAGFNALTPSGGTLTLTGSLTVTSTLTVGTLSATSALSMPGIVFTNHANPSSLVPYINYTTAGPDLLTFSTPSTGSFAFAIAGVPTLTISTAGGITSPAPFTGQAYVHSSTYDALQPGTLFFVDVDATGTNWVMNAPTGGSVLFTVDAAQVASISPKGNVTATQFTSTPVAATVTAGASTIDWSAAAEQTVALAANTTVTFSNPVSGQALILVVTDTMTGDTITLPSGKWAGGSQPAQTSGGTDIITCLYVGTTYYYSIVQGFA